MCEGIVVGYWALEALCCYYSILISVNVIVCLRRFISIQQLAKKFCNCNLKLNVRHFLEKLKIFDHLSGNTPQP